MKQYISMNLTDTRCGYIGQVEFARRRSGGTAQNMAGMETPLYMQLLAPTGLARTLRPVVVFVTGGGFHTPQVKFRLPWLVRLAERGFLVAMPEYRGTESATFPAMLEDIRDALAYIRRTAGRYGADPSKIVLMGGSAGAHLALHIAYTPNGEQEKVCGVIDLYGPTDLRRLIPPETAPVQEFCRSMPVRLTGCFSRAELESALQPTSLADVVKTSRDLPPTLILHGDADRLIPVEQSDDLYVALTKVHADADYYTIHGADHADAVFFGSEAVDLYERFIRRVTKTENRKER